MSYSSFFSISWRGLYIGLPIIGPSWSPHPLPLYVFIHQPKTPSTKTLNDNQSRVKLKFETSQLNYFEVV